MIRLRLSLSLPILLSGFSKSTPAEKQNQTLGAAILRPPAVLLVCPARINGLHTGCLFYFLYFYLFYLFSPCTRSQRVEHLLSETRRRTSVPLFMMRLHPESAPELSSILAAMTIKYLFLILCDKEFALCTCRKQAQDQGWVSSSLGDIRCPAL